MSSEMTETIAETVALMLEEYDVIVDRYHSITTSSIYLTLDYGVLKHIRVGDHKGKAKYHYTYEIGTHIKDRHSVPRDYEGTYFYQEKFPASATDSLVDHVLANRLRMYSKYGVKGYATILEQARSEYQPYEEKVEQWRGQLRARRVGA